MKKAILFILIFCVFTTLNAQTFTTNGINYSVTSPTTVEVANNAGFGGGANIPNTVTNASVSYTVTSIVGTAFSSAINLTSVTLPNTLTTIGASAFAGCSGLTSLVIPNSVNLMGEMAFNGCTSLTTVSISNSLTKIANFAFYNCKSLTSLSIPNSVTQIGDYSFSECTSLTTLNLPNSVTQIGNIAFAGCTALLSVTLPNSVASIGNKAFINCNNLASVTVNWASPLTTLGAGVFVNNAILTTLYVPTGTAQLYRDADTWRDFSFIIEGVLPLTLTSLTAKSVSNGNQINWKSENKVNVKNIVLERSGADKIFMPIVTLPFSVTQFTDNNPLIGDNYYRLSNTDNDGTTHTYNKIAFIKGLTKQINVYPNPITNGVLNVAEGSEAIKSICIINLNGIKVMALPNINKDKTVSINTHNLTKGMYLLEVKSANHTTVKKIEIF